MKKCVDFISEIPTGSCILWKSKSFIGSVIKHWSEFVHASLAIRLDRYDLLHADVFLIEAYEHGLEFNTLHEQLLKKNCPTYVFIPTELNAFNGQTIMRDAFRFLGKHVKYDYYGLVKNAFGRPYRDPSTFFCSEFVDYLWITSNLKRKIDNDLAPRPGDIPKWWEGKLVRIF